MIRCTGKLFAEADDGAAADAAAADVGIILAVGMNKRCAGAHAHNNRFIQPGKSKPAPRDRGKFLNALSRNAVNVARKIG